MPLVDNRQNLAVLYAGQGDKVAYQQLAAQLAVPLYSVTTCSEVAANHETFF